MPKLVQPLDKNQDPDNIFEACLHKETDPDFAGLESVSYMICDQIQKV